MSDKGLLSEERIAFLTDGAVERGSESAIEWAIRQAVAEAGEEAAKMLDARKTSGGAGYVLMEMARDIRNRIPLKK